MLLWLVSLKSVLLSEKQWRHQLLLLPRSGAASLAAQGRVPLGRHRCRRHHVPSPLQPRKAAAAAAELVGQRRGRNQLVGNNFSFPKDTTNKLITGHAGKRPWCSSSSYLAGNLPYAFQKTVRGHISEWLCAADCCCHASDMFEMSLFELWLATAVFKIVYFTFTFHNQYC